MCAIEQEMKGESTVNVIAEIAAEMQRGREKNAELLERISSLEAQIQERNKESLLTNEQVSCLNTTERSSKRIKRKKIETNSHRIEDGNSEMAYTAENDTPRMLEERFVNWMSMDETLFSDFDKFKDSDIAAGCDDTDDNDDEHEHYEEEDSNTGYKDRESEENLTSTSEEQPHEEGIGQGMHISCLQSCSSGRSELTFTRTNQLMKESREKDYTVQDIQVTYDASNLKYDMKATDMPPSGQGPYHTVPGKTSWIKKPPKVPFCPKEIKKILESDALIEKCSVTHLKEDHCFCISWHKAWM